MIDETSKVCCFTGHRPEKCKGTEVYIRSRLTEEIKKAIDEGIDTFITGMAPGVDTWAAEEVLRIREEQGGIKLICAVPFNGVEKNRTAEQKKDFADIMSKSDQVEYICPHYTAWCFTARDRWMVDHAKKVIAVFNGTPGGTKKTVEYAQKKTRDIVMINDSEER